MIAYKIKILTFMHTGLNHEFKMLTKLTNSLGTRLLLIISQHLQGTWYFSTESSVVGHDKRRGKGVPSVGLQSPFQGPHVSLSKMI